MALYSHGFCFCPVVSVHKNATRLTKQQVGWSPSICPEIPSCKTVHSGALEHLNITLVVRLMSGELGLEPDAVTSDLLFPCSGTLAFHHGDPQGQESKTAAHGMHATAHSLGPFRAPEWACVLGLGISFDTVCLLT